MAQNFLLHLPDGTQYGPIDRETLEAWKAAASRHRPKVEGAA